MKKMTFSGVMFIAMTALCIGIIFFTKEKFFHDVFAPSLGFAALFHSFWVEDNLKEK